MTSPDWRRGLGTNDYCSSTFISDQDNQNKMSYQTNYSHVSWIDSFQTKEDRLKCWNVPKIFTANRDITNPDSQGRSLCFLTNFGDVAKYKLELDWKLCECSTKQIDFWEIQNWNIELIWPQDCSLHRKLCKQLFIFHKCNGIINNLAAIYCT